MVHADGKQKRDNHIRGTDDCGTDNRVGRIIVGRIVVGRIVMRLNKK